MFYKGVLRVKFPLVLNPLIRPLGRWTQASLDRFLFWLEEWRKGLHFYETTSAAKNGKISSYIYYMMQVDLLEWLFSPGQANIRVWSSMENYCSFLYISAFVMDDGRRDGILEDELFWNESPQPAPTRAWHHTVIIVIQRKHPLFIIYSAILTCPKRLHSTELLFWQFNGTSQKISSISNLFSLLSGICKVEEQSTVVNPLPSCKHLADLVSHLPVSHMWNDLFWNITEKMNKLLRHAFGTTNEMFTARKTEARIF